MKTQNNLEETSFSSPGVKGNQENSTVEVNSNEQSVNFDSQSGVESDDSDNWFNESSI